MVFLNFLKEKKTSIGNLNKVLNNYKSIVNYNMFCNIKEKNYIFDVILT